MSSAIVHADASASAPKPVFADLNLPQGLQTVLDGLGFAHPTPIQAQIIPHLMAGRDVIGQAQTGTGKTAAFALPLLSSIDPRSRAVQVLVLAPTRELAGQVAEACTKFGAFIPGLGIAAVYGGAPYGEQLRALGRGAQIVVGTPGRVMDHIERGTLRLDELRCLVLDEADEMLRMGFIDDVEWVLERIPEKRQMALFSATMPPEIHRIAQRFLNNPVEITIRAATATAATIHQRCWWVRGTAKPEALCRIIEGEPVDGVLVFTKTKAGSQELAELLSSRGIHAAALNGDMGQSQREFAVEQLKAGRLDVLVATDVAARGLDVPRISHVINYDIPPDHETYVHRIGRTGRAGRSGEAILFVHPREGGILRSLERHTRQPIAPMNLPDAAAINAIRSQRFAERVLSQGDNDLAAFEQLVANIAKEHNLEPLRLAALLARMANGGRPLFLREDAQPPALAPAHHHHQASAHEPRHHSGAAFFRLAVGWAHGVKPGQIVGTLTGELGLSGQQVNRLRIHEHYCTVELPADLPAAAIDTLGRLRIAGRTIGAERLHSAPQDPPRFQRRGPGGPQAREGGFRRNRY